MFKELKNNLKRTPELDLVKKIIDTSIDYEMGDDIYYRVFPILSPYDIANGEDGLSKNKIGAKEYFTENSITLGSNSLNSDELKTISYLAPFLKEKIKYSIIEIVRYLIITGNLLNMEDKKVLDLRCVKVGDAYYDNENINNIDFYEYKTSPDKSNFFVTNIVRVKKKSEILLTDLWETINTKYLFDFLEKHNIDYTIIETIEATQMSDIQVDVISNTIQLLTSGGMGEVMHTAEMANWYDGTFLNYPIVSCGSVTSVYEISIVN